jgi:hypothetical protein
MKTWPALMLLGSALAGSAAHVDFQSPIPCTGTILLERLCDGKTCSEEGVRIDFSAPGSQQLPAGAWRATVVRGSCWTAPFETGSGDLAVNLVRFLSRSGALTSAAELPGSVSSSIRVSEVTDWIQNPGACELRGKSWRCDVPESAKDLRIEVTGFSSAYYFDFGKDELRDHVAREINPGASAVVSIRGPKGWQENAVDVTAKDMKGMTTRPAQRIGPQTFQISGLPSARYSVAAGAKQLSTVPVEFLASEVREYSLGELTLRELGSLQLTVSPAPPAGAGWTTRMLRPKGNDGMLEVVRRGATDDAGRWVADGLEFGPHVVAIADQKNAIVHQENVEIVEGGVVLGITLDQIPVRGTVSIGSEPLEATVQFHQAGARIELVSDERGSFSGMLPQEGTWQVQVTPKTERQRVRVAAEDLRRSPDGAARVDIRLPDGRIRGRVVDDAGRPVLDAEILVMRDKEVVGTVLNDGEGNFEMVGVDRGSVVLTAFAGESESTPVEYSASESPAEATLVLQHDITVPGQVILETGQPVPGAIVRYMSGIGGLGEAVADPSGRFELRAPAGSFLDVATLAPGLPIRLQRITVARDSRALIQFSRTAGVGVIRMDLAPPWPYIFSNEAGVPLPALFRPRAPGAPPAELSGAEFILELEPGDYAVCADRNRGQCVTATVPPAARVVIDARKLYAAK